MVLGNSEKVSILTAALDSRYRALETIRGRMQSVCLWSLVLLLGAAGWLAQTGAVLAADQAAILLIGAVVAWLALRFVFLGNLRTAFNAHQKVAAKLEDLLGFYDPRRFGPESEAILSEVWRAAGAKKGGGRLFHSNCLLLDLGAAMAIIAVAARSDWIRAWAPHALKLVGM